MQLSPIENVLYILLTLPLRIQALSYIECAHWNIVMDGVILQKSFV